MSGMKNPTRMVKTTQPVVKNKKANEPSERDPKLKGGP
jgi:hypothetical protein